MSIGVQKVIQLGQFVSMLDWHRASFLHAFLLADVFQNPRSFLCFPTAQHTQIYGAKEPHRPRLVHHHYQESAKGYNGVYRTALADPLGVLRRCLYTHTGDQCQEDKMIALKIGLVEPGYAQCKRGGTLCLLVSDGHDMRESDAVLQDADQSTYAKDSGGCWAWER